jgi:hypothetical protein
VTRQAPTRRALLATLAGTAGALAGCTAGYRDGVVSTPGRDESRARAPHGAPGNAGTVAESGIPPTICEEPPRRTDILAIDSPAFAAGWSDIEPARRYRPTPERHDLPDDAVVIGLTAGNRARAYPLSVLWEHEVVNDRFGGPVLVTYCPLCRSGLVAGRRVAGEPTRFQVTGLLWKPSGAYGALSETEGTVFGVDSRGTTAPARNGNLVMTDDATGSYWSQFLARAICGPQVGTTLALRPVTVATWGAWRREHPGTEVLLPPPHSGTVKQSQR